ncbi:uncharacterized protein [Macrobrachium rosenbergii]|uniref:uncharacterized protein n=1 Tax=Macrobrachium rosenbergii TaxID=79674 RepID=UPI0034D5CCDA
MIDKHQEGLKPVDYKIGDEVYIKKEVRSGIDYKLATKFTGPYKVTDMQETKAKEVRSQIRDTDTLDTGALIDVAQMVHEATKASEHATTLEAAAQEACSLTGSNNDDNREITVVFKKKPKENRGKSFTPWCFYHKKFGAKAKYCKHPCSFLKMTSAATNNSSGALNRSPSTSKFFTKDEISKHCLLVDTGAMQSVFPPMKEDLKKKPDSTNALIAANETPIRTCGTTTRIISILDRRYHWPFVIADVKFQLLGADLLGHHGLLIDVRRERLLDTGTCHSRQLAKGLGMPAICSTASSSYTSLLQEFPDVFKPELRQSPGASAKHGIFHHITTTDPPTHVKFWRLSPQKLQDTKRAFAEMERMGICKKASSPWASPLHMKPTVGATSQRLMDTILGDLPFCVCYIKDILIFSKSPEEHLQHVWAGLKRLQESGLVVRFDKCIFGKEKIDFLGHEISPSGVRPTASKVKTIEKFPEPQNIKALQEFLGMINYYRRFIPNIARIMYSLTSVLKGKPNALTWEALQQKAFSETKAALASATTLTHHKPAAALRLTTDASNITCGAVLEQIVNGAPQPLAFFSRKFSPAETRYSAFNGELLAVHEALRHFQYLLEGTEFTILMDHKPLLGIDYEDLAKEQAADPETAAYRMSLTALNINKDVRHWVRNCIACQTSKTSHHKESGMGELPQPCRCFGHIHVDIVNPIPQSGGARYLLAIIDHSTH